MRVKQISIINLFGIFNHIIPMKMEDRVTIIHGPNGFGKTIILKMINAFFEGNYSIFRLVPFDTFSMEFDDSSDITVTKFTEKGKKNGDVKK